MSPPCPAGLPYRIFSMDPTSIGIILGACAIVALGFYFLKKNREASKWKMDPRLNDLALWAYACMLDVTDLKDSNNLPVPNVKGVDEPWGNRAFGSFAMPSRNIRVQITRPY